MSDVHHIGVIDSGLGGLSLLPALKLHVQGSVLTYVADVAGFPYGSRSPEWIRQRVQALAVAAMERRPWDVLVVGCNTASTLVLPSLRAALPCPVVGVVPAVKPAAQRTQSGVIAVLATPRTIEGAYLQQLVASFAAQCRVHLRACPELVVAAEAYMRTGSVDERAVAEAVGDLVAVDALDTVVLGCTHFPLLHSALTRVLPQVRHWLDPAEAIARRVVNVLPESSVASARDNLAYVTGRWEGARDIFNRLGFTSMRTLSTGGA